MVPEQNSYIMVTNIYSILFNFLCSTCVDILSSTEQIYFLLHDWVVMSPKHKKHTCLN